MRIHFLACALSGASLLTAQTTLSLVAATPIAALTSAAGGANTLQGIAQGTPIAASPNNVFLTTSQSQNGYLSATTIVYPTLSYQGGAGFNFFERAYAAGNPANAAGTSSSTAAAGGTFGPHAVLATFAAAPGTVGNIKVSWRTNEAAAGTGTAHARVDIGNDGVLEVDQATMQEFSFPFTFPASGQVVVRVANECQSTGSGTSTSQYTWTEMWVGFQPDLTATCTISNYGTGCGGAQAVGTEILVGNTRNLLVLGTGCFPNSPVIIATGGSQLNLPLLNGCSLLCNAETLGVVTADAVGNATQSWSIPSTAVGTTNVQMLPIADQNGALVLRGTNGVRIVCTH
ncbi:MAG: hypothetical protein JNK15_17080 [Planctomycetes bacterium]|nr:hypothetical protein [Planctomycetota bacterium]